MCICFYLNRSQWRHLICLTDKCLVPCLYHAGSEDGRVFLPGQSDAHFQNWDSYKCYNVLGWFCFGLLTFDLVLLNVNISEETNQFCFCHFCFFFFIVKILLNVNFLPLLANRKCQFDSGPLQTKRHTFHMKVEKRLCLLCCGASKNNRRQA